MKKSSALRIRVEPELHRQFLEICKLEDAPAAQVIRRFMRTYIEKNQQMSQGDLFGMGNNEK